MTQTSNTERTKATQTSEMATTIANNLTDRAGAQLANIIFNDTFEGETFIEMRQKTAELITKIDFIASALRKSAYAAEDLNDINKQLKNNLPYGQPTFDTLIQYNRANGNEDPSDIAVSYTTAMQNNIREATTFITSEGEEKDIHTPLALDEEALASIERHRRISSQYGDNIPQFDETYSNLSEHIDLYDRGQTQTTTLERSFLNSPTFQGKLNQTDFAPLSDRLQGMHVGVSYNDTKESDGTPATTKYTYLNELDERTRLTYDEHEEAKNKEYDEGITKGEHKGLRGTMITY